MKVIEKEAIYDAVIFNSKDCTIADVVEDIVQQGIVQYYIFTNLGTVVLQDGDWILTNKDGKKLVFKDSEFKDKFQTLDE